MEWNASIDDIVAEMRQSYFNTRGKQPGLIITAIMSAVAVVAHGLLKKAIWVKNQITADTASPEMVEVHARNRGLVPAAGETTDELLSRYQDDVLNPKSGGNKRDWERWALEVSYTHDEGLSTEWTENVVVAKAYEEARGPGSVNIVILSDRVAPAQDGVASTELLQAVRDHLDDLHPLGIWDYEIYPAALKTVNLIATISADDYTTTAATVRERYAATLKTIPPGTGLNLITIYSILRQSGVTDASIATPAANVSVNSGPTTYERIWPGIVTLEEA